MGMVATSSSVRHSVRLGSEAVQELLGRIGRPPRDNKVGDRQPKRCAYRHKEGIVHIRQPGETADTSYLVPTQNLSSGGFSFLHGELVHIGSKCLTQLITLHGNWKDMPGRVVRCHCLKNGLYEVSVVFERPIQVSDFHEAASKVNVLVAEDNTTAESLLKRFLISLNADVKCVKQGVGMLDTVQRFSPELVIMDLNMLDGDGFTTIAQLREHEYAGFIVAITEATNPKQLGKILEAGCDEFLCKPIKREDISSLLKLVPCEPLLSTQGDDEKLASLIEEFAIELPVQVRLLEHFVRCADYVDAAELIREIRNSSETCGFKPVSDLTRVVETELIGRHREAELVDGIRRLKQLSLAVRRGLQLPSLYIIPV